MSQEIKVTKEHLTDAKPIEEAPKELEVWVNGHKIIYVPKIIE